MPLWISTLRTRERISKRKHIRILTSCVSSQIGLDILARTCHISRSHKIKPSLKSHENPLQLSYLSSWSPQQMLVSPTDFQEQVHALQESISCSSPSLQHLSPIVVAITLLGNRIYSWPKAHNSVETQAAQQSVDWHFLQCCNETGQNFKRTIKEESKSRPQRLFWKADFPNRCIKTANEEIDSFTFGCYMKCCKYSMFSVCFFFFLSYKEYKLSVFLSQFWMQYMSSKMQLLWCWFYQVFFPYNPLFYTLFNIAVGLIEGVQAD